MVFRLAGMPEALAGDLIVSWSRPGTTAKTALLSDRRHLSIEVHRPYHEIAVRRLAEAHEVDRRRLAAAALTRCTRSRPSTPA